MNTEKKWILISIAFQIISNQLFSQRIDTRNVNAFYSNGRFIAEEKSIENDSIVIINKDTSYVYVNKISQVLLEVNILNKSKNVVEFYKTWNRQKEGEYKIYYNSGKLKSVSYYHNGKLISPEIGYFENGKLQYIDDIKIRPDENYIKVSGTHIDYYESGNIQMYANLSDASDSMSAFYYYDESGKLKSQSSGLKENQKYLEYYEDGKLKMEGGFNNDIQFPQGKWVEYYSNGVIKSIKYYQCADIMLTSYPVGEWIFYDENGKELKREKQNESEPFK